MGKTSVAANLAMAWAREGLSVYAVDADPDISLGWSLGFSDDELERIPPLSELEDLIQERAGKGPFFVMNPQVDDVISDYSATRNGVHLLRMGPMKPGGSGCYCPENAFLRAVVGTLLAQRGDAVILDMGAGIEHLTRGTTEDVDLMLVVVEPSRASVKTSKAVEGLARDLGVARIRMVGNKATGPEDEEFIRSSFEPDQVLAVLPFDSEFQRSERTGTGSDGAFKEAVEGLARAIMAEGAPQ